jgi:tetratricopeptide (TPR) repeat protein
MPEKKKSTARKSTERRMTTNPQATASVKSSEPVRVVAAAPWNGQKQLSSFEAAMKLFHTRNMKQARELFEQAAQGPERDVAQRSRLHIAMCDRRLEQDGVSLRSAEEYYTYGIALMNSRKIAEARTHLEQALRLAPEADHIHYAVAAAQALNGDLTGAHEHLKRAIEIEPRNRLHARQDADFAQWAHQPPFDALLYPEKTWPEKTWPEKTWPEKKSW